MAARFVTRSPFAIRTHPHLYEINTWAWLEELSVRLSRPITLAEVPDAEWDSLARLGFNIVWLMGVWQRSPESQRIKLENPQNHPEFESALPGWKPSDAIGSPTRSCSMFPIRASARGTLSIPSARSFMRGAWRYFSILSAITQRSIVPGPANIRNSTFRERKTNTIRIHWPSIKWNHPLASNIWHWAKIPTSRLGMTLPS